MWRTIHRPRKCKAHLQSTLCQPDTSGYPSHVASRRSIRIPTRQGGSKRMALHIVLQLFERTLLILVTEFGCSTIAFSVCLLVSSMHHADPHDLHDYHYSLRDALKGQHAVQYMQLRLQTWRQLFVSRKMNLLLFFFKYWRRCSKYTEITKHVLFFCQHDFGSSMSMLCAGLRKWRNSGSDPVNYMRNCANAHNHVIFTIRLQITFGTITGTENTPATFRLLNKGFWSS